MTTTLENNAAPPVDVPRLVRLDISVAADGIEIWRRTLNPDGGMSRRDAGELRIVVSALESALIQARADLGSVDPNVVSDVGAVAFTHVDGDVPVASMRGGNAHGESLKEASVIGETSASLVGGEVKVIGKHDVALGVAVDDDNVSRIEVFSGVDEVHGSDDVGEDSLANK